MTAATKAAEVLAAHQRWAAWSCICGERFGHGTSSEVRDAALAAHQAEALAAAGLLAEVERLAPWETLDAVTRAVARVTPCSCSAQRARAAAAEAEVEQLTAERDAARAEVAVLREGMFTLIGDLDDARADGAVWTYGGVQRRLRTLLAAPSETEEGRA